jgi:hypothetical protein
VNNFALGLLVLYFITLVSLIFTRFSNVKLGNFIAIITSLITFIIASLRPSEFPDYDTYELIFDFCSTGDFSNNLYWLAHGEPGFKIMSYFLHYLGANYSLFLLFMALLSYFLLLKISKISKIPFSYLWFTYFSFYFITRDLGVIRLSIASHLIVIMLLKRKLLSKIIIVVFASITFQYLSFIALAAPLLSKYKLNVFRILLLLVIAVFLSSFLSFAGILDFMPEKQSINYDGLIMSEPTFTPVIRNLLFAGFIFFLFKKELKNRIVNSWVWSVVLSVVLYILTFNILILSQRTGAYFGAIIPIVLAYKLNRTSSSDSVFYMVSFICVLNFISLFYYNDFVWKIY